MLFGFMLGLLVGFLIGCWNMRDLHAMHMAQHRKTLDRLKSIMGKIED